MFTKILVPVDLAHADRQTRALDCAADIAGLYNAQIILVGVTTEAPSAIARNHEEYAAKLAQFAQDLASRKSREVTSQVMIAHDPTADLDVSLLKAIRVSGADLVVMSSHDPGMTSYIWPSNGGKVAGHAHVTVMVVRD
ncbi:universal stress protein [Pararhodobacter oceanensis]|uniref:Universal stress protein UspA n=1 Tax=Pararhodobacter oceanensis TaxID=2172121 RepID=A0A2T8HS19_9RHOB|nr:universal stress protein [Pararhodobacter oceanensis]PVH28231.1 universal stress protein UspA [Pararhodobacter oceanensis]